MSRDLRTMAVDGQESLSAEREPAATTVSSDLLGEPVGLELENVLRA